MRTYEAEDYRRAGRLLLAARVTRADRPHWRKRSEYARDVGVGRATISAIETGNLGRRKHGFDPVTVAVLEAAVGWETGSYERALEGKAPILKPEAAPIPQLPREVVIRIDDIQKSDALTDREKERFVEALLTYGRPVRSPAPAIEANGEMAL